MPKKQDPDSKYGEKLIRLFSELLFTGRSHSMSDLSDMLGCSKPTIRRLVDDVSCSYSVQIEEETRGKQLYFRIPRPHQLNPVPISAGELAVLGMCRAFTRHLLGKKQFEEAARGLQKSSGLLPRGETLPPCEVFACFQPGSIDYTGCQEVLNALIEAIGKKHICRVEYLSLGTDAPRTFCVMPLKIFSYRDTIYMHARRTSTEGEPKEEDDFDPLLAVHRLKNVEVLEVAYEFPKDYDFEEVFNQTFGVIKEKTFRVKLALSGWAARYASERIWSPDQKSRKSRTAGSS